jgi:G3E family GTPase
MKVPITLITGYLGSGKTTLVLNLLQNSNKKIAVLLNEFGDSAGIDKSLKKNESVFEEWLELNNGCLCCSVKENGVLAVEKLLREKGPFDAILLETTGLADPGPIAKMFWLDDELQSLVYLDGIVTVVDAKYILQQLDAQKLDNMVNEAITQVALADRIVINKMDLVDQDQLQAVKDKITGINGSAIIRTSTRSDVDMDFVLDIHSFDKRTEKDIRNIPQTSNHLDKSVITVAFTLEGVFSIEKIDVWIRNLLWEKEIDGAVYQNMEVFRIKMLINANDSKSKIIFQAVRELYDQQEGNIWGEEKRETKLVFIGKNLNRQVLLDSFTKSCRL